MHLINQNLEVKIEREIPVEIRDAVTSPKFNDSTFLFLFWRTKFISVLNHSVTNWNIIQYKRLRLINTSSSSDPLHWRGLFLLIFAVTT